MQVCTHICTNSTAMNNRQWPTNNQSFDIATTVELLEHFLSVIGKQLLS